MKMDFKAWGGIFVLGFAGLLVMFFMGLSPSSSVVGLLESLPDEVVAVSLKPDSPVDFLERNLLSGLEITRAENKASSLAVIYLEKQNKISSVNLYKALDEKVEGKVFEGYELTGDPADLDLFKEKTEENNLQYLNTFLNNNFDHQYLIKNSFAAKKFPYFKDYLGNEKEYLGAGWNTSSNSISFSVAVKDKIDITKSTKYFNLSDPTILAIGEGVPFSFIIPEEFPPLFDAWLLARGIKDEALSLQKIFNKSYVSFALLEWKGNYVPVLAGSVDGKSSEKIDAIKKIFNKYLSNKYSVPQRITGEKGELIKYLKPIDTSKLVSEESVGGNTILKFGCLDTEDALRISEEEASCDFEKTGKKIIILINDNYFLASNNQEVLMELNKSFDGNNFQKNTAANFYFDAERLKRIPKVEENLKMIPEKNRTILDSVQLMRLRIVPQTDHTNIEGDISFGRTN